MPTASTARANDGHRRLPLVYILSSGRSGSTLLDLLLGQHERLWTLGEFQVLPFELAENRAPCACGEPLERCPFFAPLLDRLCLEDGQARLAHFRDSHGFGRVVRPRLALDIALGGPRGARRPAAEAYGELNRRLLDQIWQAAQQGSEQPLAYLVDASKDPYRLAWLAASGCFDIRVIHVIKDPRGFVHSMTRQAGATLGKVLRFTGRWLFENGLMAYLGSTLPAGNTLTLRYEELAGAPERALARIGAWLELPFEPDHHEGLRRRTVHAISGNEMRWQAGGVRLDQRWRQELPGWARLLVGAWTWPWWSRVPGLPAKHERARREPLATDHKAA